MAQPVFNILAIERAEGMFTVALDINGDSQIFDGHFPGQPVVPGASMLQLVKNVLSEQLSLKLKLSRADNIKYLGLVQPGLEKISLHIGYQNIENQLKVNATLSAKEVTFMKLQGTFMMV